MGESWCQTVRPRRQTRSKCEKCGCCLVTLRLEILESDRGTSVQQHRRAVWSFTQQCVTSSLSSQCIDASPGDSTMPALELSVVSEEEPTTMSADTESFSRAEMDSEHNCELADLVAAMNVASNRITPPNGYRSGAPRVTKLSDRKMSLQERGSRIARQPTIETKRVSITDADVRTEMMLRVQFFNMLLIRSFTD